MGLNRDNNMLRYAEGTRMNSATFRDLDDWDIWLGGNAGISRSIGLLIAQGKTPVKQHHSYKEQQRNRMKHKLQEVGQTAVGWIP